MLCDEIERLKPSTRRRNWEVTALEMGDFQFSARYESEEFIFLLFLWPPVSVSFTKISIQIKVLLKSVLLCLPYQTFKDIIFNVSLIILIYIHYIQGQTARKL